MIDIKSLETKLEKLPSEIYEAEKLVITAKAEVEVAKIEHGCAYADALIRADAPNATEKKAMAELASKTEKMNILTSQVLYEQENAKLTALNNQFNTLRKIGSIETELMRANVSGN